MDDDAVQYAMIPEREAMENFIDQSQFLNWLNVRMYCLREYMYGNLTKVYPCMLGDFAMGGKMFTAYADGVVPCDGWDNDNL